MIPEKALRDKWRAEVATAMHSALGEYCPREFLTLLDAVDHLEGLLAVKDRHLFEMFWKRCGPALAFSLASQADKKTEDDYKDVFRAIFNDAQQLMLSRIVFLIYAKRRTLVSEHVEGQQTTAAVINALGKLAVQISELET